MRHSSIVVVVVLIMLFLTVPYTNPSSYSQPQQSDEDDDNNNNNQSIIEEVDIRSIMQQLGGSEEFPTRFALLDWSADGQWILFKYEKPLEPGDSYLGLAAMTPDGKEVKIIDVKDKLEDLTPDFTRKLEIKIAKFSPTDKDKIYLLYHYARFDPDDPSVQFKFVDDIYSYDQKEATLTRLTETGRIIWFDVMPDGKRLLYAEALSYDDESTTTQQFPPSVLWLAHASNGTQIGNSHFAGGDFLTDLSPDGSKLVASPLERGKIVVSEVSDSSREWKSTSIPNPDNVLILDVQWAPNSQYVVYSWAQEVGFRSPLQPAYISLSSVDGSFGYNLFEPSSSKDDKSIITVVSMLPSPDGRSILVGTEGGTYPDMMIATKLYRLELANPIPEFGSIAPLIMAVAIVSAIIAAKRFRSRLR